MNTQTPDHANVIALFESAHKAALAEADNETSLFTEAFDAAEECGWDWESDTNFTNWCLKATSPEIAEEGLRLFLQSQSIPAPISIREMNVEERAMEGDCETEGKCWIAVWQDRQGWFTENNGKFSTTVSNDGIASEDRAKVLSFLYRNVETS